MQIAENLYIGLGPRGESGENFNARGAMLHALGGVGTSVGVVVGALWVRCGWPRHFMALAITGVAVKEGWENLAG